MTNKTSTMIQFVRDDLRERRAARAEYRALKSALASCSSPAEIDDVLLIAEAQGADTENVRDILAGNRQRHDVLQHGGLWGLSYSA